MSRPLATVSVDLDNLWAYQRAHADPGWEKLSSYLHIAVPRMLEILREAGITATVFIVGADAAKAEAPELLRPIAEAGHEIGNHSYGHATWLHRWHVPEIRAELAQAHEAIVKATGRAPVGFRGPGFAWSTALLAAVAERGYLYDASVLPTRLAPYMRRRLLRDTKLTETELNVRRELFGPAEARTCPKRAFRWRLPDGQALVELPVTTVTPMGLPFHQSYLGFIATRSAPLARTYRQASLAWCRMWGVAPSFLLHPLDWLGPEEVPELRFFPGMALPLDAKLALLRSSLQALSRGFSCVTMEELARRRSADGRLGERVPAVLPTRWSRPPRMEAEARPFRAGPAPEPAASSGTLMEVDAPPADG